MLRSALSMLGVILAVLCFAVLAGTDARAGGVGHHHPGAAATTHSGAHAPARDTTGGAERVGHPDRTAGHKQPTDPDAAGGAPCGGGHSDDGSMCCGVACHAAMPAAGDGQGLVLPVGPVKSPSPVETRGDRLVLLIERPPRD